MDIYGEITPTTEIKADVNVGGGSYTLPPATSSALGGVKADQKTSGDTQPVRIGSDGKLWTATGGGDTGETKFIFTKNPKVNSNGTLIYGQCVIALGEKTGLFDLGMDESMTSVISILNANNITTIDYIVISHYHTDHSTNDVVTAVKNLANSFDLSNCVFYLPHKGIDWSKFTSGSENKQSTETALISELTSKGYNFIKADASNVYDVDGSTTVEFFNVGPYPDDFYNYKLDQNQQANNKNGTVQTNYNAFAMLCMIHDHGKNILITSDATWNALDAVTNVGNCDIVTIEHHGLERKTSEIFYERIRPKAGIVFNYSENHNTDELRYIPSVLKASRTASIYDNINNDVVVTVSASGFDVDGDAVDVNYSAQYEFDSACLLDVVNAYLDVNPSVSITGNNQYFEMNGAFVQVGKQVYFKAIGTYKKNVNNGSGVGIASNLPIPNNKNIRFVFKNELGEEAYSHMFYESGWRTNGTEVTGNRRFIVGCYEAEAENTFTPDIKTVKELSSGGTGGISDVQVNGTSVVDDGVANIPKASASQLGVVATDSWNGTTVDSSGHIGLFASQQTHLDNRTSNTAITPKNLDYAVTAVLTDGKAPALTDAQKAAAQSWLGIDTILGLVDAVSEVVG